MTHEYTLNSRIQLLFLPRRNRKLSTPPTILTPPTRRWEDTSILQKSAAALVLPTGGNHHVSERAEGLGIRTAQRHSQCAAAQSLEAGEALYGAQNVVLPPQKLYQQWILSLTPQKSEVESQIHKFTQQSEVGVLRFLASSPQQVERIVMLARTFRLMGSPRRCSSELVVSTRKSSITSVNTRGDSQAENRPPHCFRCYVTKPIAGVRKGPTFVRTFSGGEHPEIVPGADRRIPVHGSHLTENSTVDNSADI